MAPIAASSQSKSKLKAFQYEQTVARPPATTDEADKENAPHHAVTAPSQTSQMVPPPQPLSQRSAGKDTRDCPQTPLGRLPLTDLLALGEDSCRGNLNLTPIERVLWDNTTMSSDPTNSIPARKGRKRAHSSSPASSSQNETSGHFAKRKEAVDLEALQKTLRTPKVDPADDLWTRYSLNTDTIERQSPTARAKGGFAHLMHSSSPQTPFSHVQKDSGGLRRSLTLSCIEWPVSAAKRRKRFHHGSQKNFAADNDIDEQSATNDRSKMSRVSLLVDKIHDGLVRPGTHAAAHSSSEPAGSSPGTERNGTPSSSGREDEFPDQESQEAINAVVNVLSQTSVDALESFTGPLILSNEEIRNLGRADSSDFDDDDLDLEMMEDIDTKFEAERPAIRKSPESNLPIPKPPSKGTEKEDDTKVSFQSEGIPATMNLVPPNDDEFDDDGSEIFAADLEDVCAKYDSQVQQQPSQILGNPQENRTHAKEDLLQGAKLMHKKPPTTVIEVLSDDEDFGSDSDFEQIAAECADATQQQQASRSQSFVRTGNFGLST